MTPARPAAWPGAERGAPARTRFAARPARPPGAVIEADITPPSPYALPRYAGQDGTLRCRRGVAERYFEIDDHPVLVRAWQPVRNRVCVRAEAVAPGPSPAAGVPPVAGARGAASSLAPAEPARSEHLERALARMRFALSVDHDLSDFYARFRRDRLLGRLIHLRPELRATRLTTAWDALAWAIAGQLIDGRRASLIARRIVRRWGRPGPGGLADTPAVQAIADRAPAELEACDLAGRRAIAMRIAAREIAAGRIDPADPAADSRLLAIPQIGPWTVQCLALHGRGDDDSLPAGDLDYLKLAGRLLTLGRRAEIAEVEDFFEPYRPYRGLAGEWMRQSFRGFRV